MAQHAAYKLGPLTNEWDESDLIGREVSSIVPQPRHSTGANPVPYYKRGLRRYIAGVMREEGENTEVVL